MNEEFAAEPGRSKAAALCDAINGLLFELVLRCIKDPTEGPRYYFDVGVIGYGESVGPALGGALAGRELVSIADIANHPLRVEDRNKAEGETSARPAKHLPVWFDAKASNGTPMCGAIDVAGTIAAKWVAEHPDSFPPIIINISDGAATDGDPREWARRLQSLSTRDGNALMFNVNLSALGRDPLFFPSDDTGLGDGYARALFDMSSALPPFMCQLTQQKGLDVRDDARGFVFNADMAAVITFLQIGTAIQHMIGERTI
jgi:hypothetical protein